MSTSVLICEESPELRELIVDTLESAGFLAQGAADVQEALRVLKQLKMDVLIMEGRAAASNLEYVKRREPNLRCVVIGPYDFLEALPETLKAHIDHFIYRPLEIQAVVDAVKRVSAGTSRTTMLWNALLAVPKKLISKADQGRRESARKSLQDERNRVLRGLHAGIQADLLTRGAALDVWDRLGVLEAEKAEKPADIYELAGRYTQLFDWMTGLAQTRAAGSQRKRKPQETARFGRLYERVQAGLVGAERMEKAWETWLDEKASPDGELLWGEKGPTPYKPSSPPGPKPAPTPGGWMPSARTSAPASAPILHPPGMPPAEARPLRGAVPPEAAPPSLPPQTPGTRVPLGAPIDAGGPYIPSTKLGSVPLGAPFASPAAFPSADKQTKPTDQRD